jgi:hypothetical protein
VFQYRFGDVPEYVGRATESHDLLLIRDIHGTCVFPWGLAITPWRLVRKGESSRGDWQDKYN